MTILEAIRWVAQPLEKQCEIEVENIDRAILCIDDAMNVSTVADPNCNLKPTQTTAKAASRCIPSPTSIRLHLLKPTWPC